MVCSSDADAVVMSFFANTPNVSVGTIRSTTDGVVSMQKVRKDIISKLRNPEDPSCPFRNLDNKASRKAGTAQAFQPKAQASPANAATSESQAPHIESPTPAAESEIPREADAVNAPRASATAPSAEPFHYQSVVATSQSRTSSVSPMSAARSKVSRAAKSREVDSAVTKAAPLLIEQWAIRAQSAANKAIAHTERASPMLTTGSSAQSTQDSPYPVREQTDRGASAQDLATATNKPANIGLLARPMRPATTSLPVRPTRLLTESRPANRVSPIVERPVSQKRDTQQQSPPSPPLQPILTKPSLHSLTAPSITDTLLTSVSRVLPSPIIDFV